MGRQATMELDQEHEALQVQLAEAYTAATAEKERELADLRAQLARVQGNDPPALGRARGNGRGATETYLNS
jgi:hypothetical protein